MTDKVQKIREEIEKELTVLDKTSVYDIGRASELNHLLLFIDSLPKEPVSEDSVPNVTDRHEPTKESIQEICQILNEPRSYRSSDSKKQPFIQDLD